MKKNILNFFGIAVLAMSLFTNCKPDPTETDKPDEVAGVKENLQKGIMKGALKEDFTLDAAKPYSLTGAFVVNEGATLTIPAGTNIIADAAGTDVYIAVMMGGKIDIQGTAASPVVMSSADANPGDWGGLTICGRATTSAGADSEAEVGGFIYGGDKDDDNSGSIKYLVIKGTGAQIKPESQYNGVSLYSVGSGTTIENVAIINGADDGVEFFGGTVSVKNIYLENNEDDAVDWTDGWSGGIENTYISHTIEGFSTAFEGDKENNNPKFKNVTAISTVGGKALQFKKQSGATITNLHLSGYDKNIDMKDNGPLENVIIDGESADPNADYSTGTPVDISGWTWASAGVQVTSWVGDKLKGSVEGIVTLNAGTAYTLESSLTVKDGASLIIPAGTKITADDAGTEVYIAVMMGGRIYINGTEEKPVVMSSANGVPGDWGGLTICGRATTSAGANSTAEVGGFVYGGDKDDDNSGEIKYLVIKGTGAQINSESQYNGISLYAVGSGTTIENVAVIDGSDDGIEFFGGTVNVTNIYLENNEDDAVDWTEGWSGGITNTYISHTVAGFSTAFEGDRVNNNPLFTNVTAISTVGGKALQFKAESGATINNLYLEGYDTNIDMKDNGPLGNVIIDGATADPEADYNTGTKVDISTWTWRQATL